MLGIPLAYEGAGEVDTLGGLIMAIAGSMPKRGQTVQHPSGVTFEILEAGPRRLHSVRIPKQLALVAPDTPLLLPPPGRGGRRANRIAARTQTFTAPGLHRQLQQAPIIELLGRTCCRTVNGRFHFLDI